MPIWGLTREVDEDYRGSMQSSTSFVSSRFRFPWLIPVSLPSPNLLNCFVYLPRENRRRFDTGGCKASPLIISSSAPSRRTRADEDGGSAVERTADFIVVNFYRFVFISDPELEVSKHLFFLQDLDIHGRIYLNEQGINAQFSGPSKDALEYTEWIKEDERFSDILVQTSPSFSGHAFPRLKLRYKPSLVQVEGGNQGLPLVDPSMRAKPLTPVEWRQRLLKSGSIDGDASNDNTNKNYILLDVRNGYEWDIGHFDGALRPEVDCFKSTSFGLSESEVHDSDPLANIDKDHTEVLMYCTGGIRCDVYSTMLRQKGFKLLYTLKGGVSHYLEKEGPTAWVGNLFVFDSRLSLPPSTFNPGSAQANENMDAANKSNFARCYICGSQIHDLRHRNCANIDCNLLFLSCSNCVEELRGCCCSPCTSAPRLRPLLHGIQRYDKWHHYRDSNLKGNQNSS